MLAHIVEILERKIYNIERVMKIEFWEYCSTGLSYVKAGEIAGVSHEAIREWYQKGKELFELASPKERNSYR